MPRPLSRQPGCAQSPSHHTRIRPCSSGDLASTQALSPKPSQARWRQKRQRIPTSTRSPHRYPVSTQSRSNGPARHPDPATNRRLRQPVTHIPPAQRGLVGEHPTRPDRDSCHHQRSSTATNTHLHNVLAVSSCDETACDEGDSVAVRHFALGGRGSSRRGSTTTCRTIAIEISCASRRVPVTAEPESRRWR